MKKLIRVESDVIRCNNLKKGQRQMVSIAGRLYRIDDDLMIADNQTSDCIVVYGLDDTQPMLPKKKLVNPDMTRVFIRSAKISGNKRKVWLQLDTTNFVKWISIIAIVGGTLYGFLSFGGVQL